MIHFEDWERLDLRVGKIIKVKDHPNANKLYVLTVDFNEETGHRTIVTGLKEFCKKEDLEGKSAIFVLNLEPVNIRGIKSEGMILAAESPGTAKTCILVPDDEEIEAGSKVR